MVGFFSRSDFAPDSPANISTVKKCGACKLHKEVIHPNIPPEGKGKAGWLIVSEPPSIAADHDNVTLDAEQERALIRMLPDGIDLWEDCWVVNAVTCCCQERDATVLEIESCRSVLFGHIQRLKPKRILLLGDTAIRAVFGQLAPHLASGMDTWRGWVVPDQSLQAWVCATYVPWKASESKYPELIELFIKKDISNLLLAESLPAGKLGEIEIFPDAAGAEALLLDLVQNPPEYLVLDYETTSLKPQAPQQRIVCAALAFRDMGRIRSCAFMMEGERVLRLFYRLMVSPFIPKGGANIKFEEMWTKTKLGYSIVNWDFDCVLGAHILDNRSSITSVKFQSYVRFGVPEYNSHISPFLKGTEDCGNSMNQIHKISKRDLLEYCAMDSLYEFALIERMKRELAL